MRRLYFAALVVAVALLTMSGTAGGQTPGEDSVTGTGTASFWGQFQIDVRSGASGENPSGQASFNSAVEVLSGSIRAWRSATTSQRSMSRARALGLSRSR